MGTYYYIANHKTKTFFELGKFYDFVNIAADWGDYWKTDKECFNEMFEEIYCDREWAEETNKDYLTYLKARLWRFIQEIDGPEDLIIVNDGDDSYFDLRYSKDEHGRNFRDERGGSCGILYKTIDGRFANAEDIKHFLQTGEFRRYMYHEDDH